MKEKLYNKQVFWIKDFEYIAYAKIKTFNINLSNHAIDRLEEKGINYDILMSTIKSLKRGQQYYGRYGIFEIQSNKHSKEINKMLIKVPYDERYNLIIVMQEVFNFKTRNKNLLIKTCWLNKISDNHYTLDRRKYMKKLY